MCNNFNILKIFNYWLLDGCSGKDLNRRELIIPLLMSMNCSVLNFKDCGFQVFIK